MQTAYSQYGRSAMDARAETSAGTAGTGKTMDRSMLEAILFSFFSGQHKTLEDAAEKAGFGRHLASSGHQAHLGRLQIVLTGL